MRATITRATLLFFPFSSLYTRLHPRSHWYFAVRVILLSALLIPSVAAAQIPAPQKPNRFLQDSIATTYLHPHQESTGLSSAGGLDAVGIVRARSDGRPNPRGAASTISGEYSFRDRTDREHHVPSPSNSLPDSVYEIWVRQYSSGLVPGTETVRAMRIDDQGNQYVTGFTTSGCTSADVLTIKYDASGEEQWVARFNGPGYTYDVANALAIDTFGNVYVAGSRAFGDAADYVTIKYSANGVEQWIAYYDGPEHTGDDAYAIALDDSGNVYVTGASNRTSATPADCATIKYNAEGIVQWVARYDGGNNDLAVSIAVDDSGDVIVTGFSWDSVTENDYVTIKYDNSGAEQWVARYNGFGGPGNSSDWARELALDNSGNVHVTGFSVGPNHHRDYTTVKYNPEGVELWVARYDGPAGGWDEAEGIAVDEAGNVYVTGRVSGIATSNDFATVKYDASGVELWVAGYSGPGSSSDAASDIVVDHLGNVYVAGTSDLDYVTIKYDNSGLEEWVATYENPGTWFDEGVEELAVDNSGNVYVTGTTNTDYTTIKYDSGGAVQWTSRYIDPGSSWEIPYDLKVDGFGNSYVTGMSYVSGSEYTYTTIKYNSAGVEEWVARYDGGAEYDHLPSLAIDNDGNVYVAGTSDSGYVTIKYNPMGVETWVARFRGPGEYGDIASDIALDPEGNVYVTGSSSGLNTYFDYGTVKYNSLGTELWVARYSSPGSEYDQAVALAIDNSGNILVTGSSSSWEQITTVRFNPEGIEEWSAHYGGFSGGQFGVALAVDDAENIYVTGSSFIVGGYSDYVTVKYNSAGEQLWSRRYDGGSSGTTTDHPNAIAADNDGNVYVTGESDSYGAFISDYATIKYDTFGNEQWVARYDGPSLGDDAATSLALDNSGSIVVTGSSESNYVTIKYDHNGSQQWVVSYNGENDADDSPAVLAVDELGDVYVTGNSYSGCRIFSTIKYSETPTGIRDPSSPLPREFALYQNYPNPFNPSTTIRFSIPKSSEVSLTIFNLLGEEVATLISGIRDAGFHTIQWDATGQPSGVYFYELRAGEFVETRKLVLLR